MPSSNSIDLKVENRSLTTINDFLKFYKNLIRINDNPPNLNGSTRIIKIRPLIQYASLKDVKKIQDLFYNVYKGTYPYKEFEDLQRIKKMITNINFNWVLIKINSDSIVGCYGFKFNLNKKSGTFHGLVLEKEYHGVIDILDFLLRLKFNLYRNFKDKILVWSCEIRTANPASQYLGYKCGFFPIAFLPNKDIFFNKIESTIMIVIYDKKALIDFRKKEEPRIIRQVLNSFVYSNKKYNLGTPLVQNPNITLNKKKLNYLKLKISKKEKNKKFGKKIIKYNITNSRSYFRFEYHSFIQSIEKVKFRVLELEELYIFIQFLKKFMDTNKTRYCECYVSAYNPYHQKLFYEAGYIVAGYIPSWNYNIKKKQFEDCILFVFNKEPINTNINITPETKELMKSINIFKEKKSKDLFEFIE